MIFGFSASVLAVVMLALVFGHNRFEMDYHERFSFFAIHGIYRRIATQNIFLGIGLALAAAHFTPNSSAGILLAVSVVYALIFVAWMTWCYENYLHSKYPLNAPEMRYRSGGVASPSPGDIMSQRYVGPSSYTSWHYAITIVTGVTSYLLFIIGFLRFIVDLEAVARMK